MTAPLLESQVLDALRVVRDPDLGRDIVSLGFVKDVRFANGGGTVAFSIELTTPACPVREQMQQEARRAVAALPGVTAVEVKLTSRVRSSPGPVKEQLIPTVKNVVPVASGKGGVGKSTVTVNLALALARTGARVGIMDADVYGPSVPTLMGVADLPKPTADGIVPAERYGVKLVSMGFFLREDDAIIWRGPMLHKTVQHFLGNVQWGELDYLLVDLPPGTGDVQLTLCQSIPLTGAAVVSTPQDVALKVAQKAIAMFTQLNTPVLGLIENMAYYVCPHCGSRDEVFGSGGVRRAAERLQIPFLGEIPLATEIRARSDAGRPVVLDPASTFGDAYLAVAERLAAQVSIRNMQRELTPLVQITF
ncbi:MAG TPA: Mrp/NBP35 family ATP-binding protein [Gemmatimonadales bacterium]|nr:Mrp/NBP35 family ATP-binding protein [Gemmatimonadales bacterium]